MTLNSVVLPTPFGPMILSISPLSPVPVAILTRIARRGEYPSPDEAASAVATHRRVADEIAAGRAAEAERVARAHLAATQQLVLSRFETDIVTVSSARQAFGASRLAGF